MKLLLLTLLVFSPNLAAGDQATVDYLATFVTIEYHVLDNLEPPPSITFAGEIIFINDGFSAVTDLNWSLYFCSLRLFEPNTIHPDGAPLGETGLMVYHINGCLHRIAPSPTFPGIGTGVRLVVPFDAIEFQATATEIMPNWYFVDEESEPRISVSTAGEDMSWIGDFTTENQWKKSLEDRYNPYSGTDRYNAINYNDLGARQTLILPTPVDEGLQEMFTVNIGSGDWLVVVGSPDVSSEAQFLAAALGVTAVDPEFTPASRYIQIETGQVLDSGGVPVTEQESYRLDVQILDQVITIVGLDTAGAFYGVQSLLSLYDYSPDIPNGYVVDYPRYPYRGMHADVARQFYNKDEILKLLDSMAMYKMNKFHFHITDDESWRLEIPSIPELTEVGSRRCHDLSGDICLMPFLGTGPALTNDGSGYYSVADYKEILTFANERHIQVIPEFDMPGHGHAAINAMNARYRKYIDTDPATAVQYLLADPDDNSGYESVQRYTDNAINPCIESTYDFISTIISDVLALHADIQPLTAFNFGGDEVPVGAWVSSPACANISTDPGYLKEYFVTRTAELAAAAGLDLMGWEDGFLTGGVPIDPSTLPNSNLYIYAWNNVFEWGTGERAYVLANAGYKTVMASSTHMYFDHPYEPDPYDRGNYWATRITPNYKAFGYMPDDLYENIGVDNNGAPLNKDQICASFGCTPLTPEGEANIIGIQGHVWGETVRKAEYLEGHVYPRLLSVAERGWHKAAWESVTDPGDREIQRVADFERFANTLGYKELARLDKRNVHYHLNPPGAQVPGNFRLLQALAEFPGLPIFYSENDGASWTEYVFGSTQVNVGTVQVVTRSTNGLRSSRPTIIEVT